MFWWGGFELWDWALLLLRYQLVLNSDVWYPDVYLSVVWQEPVVDNFPAIPPPSRGSLSRRSRQSWLNAALAMQKEPPIWKGCLMLPGVVLRTIWWATRGHNVWVYMHKCLARDSRYFRDCSSISHLSACFNYFQLFRLHPKQDVWHLLMCLLWIGVV